MKIAVGIAVVAALTLIGKCFSEKYKRKSEFFESLYYFNRDLSSNISYKKDSLSILIKKKYSSEDFNRLLNNAFANDELCELPRYLCVGEIDFLREYFNSIGKNTSFGEADYIEHADAIIKAYRDESKKFEVKYSPLYVKLGFTLGLTAFILII